MSATVAIIGSGLVGSAIAYTLMLKNVCTSIALIDIDENKSQGEVWDLSDSLLQSKIAHLKVGTFADTKQADIIIIAAGIRQSLGQTRIALLDTNKKIIEQIMKEITPLKKNACIIMVTNPVDILTYLALKLSGLPSQQVFGSGAILEGMRLRNFISHKLEINPESIQVYVLGEHGPSQFPAWSISSIAGIPITQFPGLSTKDFADLSEKTERHVYEIIKSKGSTYYGVASCVSMMCENIIFNRNQIIPLSCYLEEYKTCLTIPVMLGQNGIGKTYIDQLSKPEKELLDYSAKSIINSSTQS